MYPPANLSLKKKNEVVENSQNMFLLSIIWIWLIFWAFFLSRPPQIHLLYPTKPWEMKTWILCFHTSERLKTKYVAGDVQYAKYFSLN